jgi:hypothetical protein
VSLVSRRGRTISGRTGLILGLWVGAAIVAGLASFAHLPGILPEAVVILAWLGAFLLGQRLVEGSGWGLIGGVLAAGTFVVATFYGVHASTLALGGATVTATVVDINTARAKSSTTYLYKLAGPDGHDIGGRLSEDFDLFDVGDQVVVVADPAGLVDPELPGEVDAGRPIWITSGISFVVTGLMALWMAWIPRKVPAPLPSRSPSTHTL